MQLHRYMAASSKRFMHGWWCFSPWFPLVSCHGILFLYTWIIEHKSSNNINVCNLCRKCSICFKSRWGATFKPRLCSSGWDCRVTHTTDYSYCVQSSFYIHSLVFISELSRICRPVFQTFYSKIWTSIIDTSTCAMIQSIPNKKLTYRMNFVNLLQCIKLILTWINIAYFHWNEMSQCFPLQFSVAIRVVHPIYLPAWNPSFYRRSMSLVEFQTKVQ